MSNDFKKVLLKDDRLMVSDSVEYAVFKGGQNVVPSVQPSVSQQGNTSSVSFNIQVPSEQTLVDRRVMYVATTTMQFTASTAPVLGQNFSLSAFPNHQVLQTITTTINNNTTSINIRDVLPAVLKTMCSEDLQRYSSTTPVASDVLQTYYPNSNYTNIGLPNSILGGYECSGIDNDLRTNGSFAGFNFRTSNTTVSNVSVTAVGGGVYTLTFTTCEPLICPPFAWNEPCDNNSSIYGVQNMNIVLNIGNGNRCFRATPACVITNVTGVSVSDPQLLLQYITAHPSDLMPARNVVNYLEYPRYFTTTNTVIAQNAAESLNSSTFNLNQIPDKLIIFCRKPQQNQTNNDSDFSLPITGISINFNNNSGILSSATPYDLFRASVEAGSNQSWQEFSGASLSTINTGTAIPTPYVPVQSVLPTVGSYLMLDFGKHIQLTEDYYAPGSLGNFQLQFSLNVKNTNTGGNFTPEIVLITVNSGIFVTERGQSSVYTGILTKQDVLDASQQTPLGQSTVHRLIGGGASSKGKVLNVHKMKQLHMTRNQPAPSLSLQGSTGSAMRHPLSSRLM
jgi:hypothetical protein